MIAMVTLNTRYAPRNCCISVKTNWTYSEVSGTFLCRLHVGVFAWTSDDRIKNRRFLKLNPKVMYNVRGGQTHMYICVCEHIVKVMVTFQRNRYSTSILITCMRDRKTCVYNFA